jgi:Leucine-rich repeat (LRR) protein
VAEWVTSKGGKVTTDAASRIVGIDLSYTWIGDTDLDRIGRLKDLRSLELSFVRVTDRGIERLRDLPNIDRLNLHSAEHITDFALTYLRGWKNLRWLDLGGTDITDIGVELLSDFKSLESLDISGTQATDNGIEFLAALPRLRELKIGGNVMTAGALMALRVLPNLVSLDLSGVQRRNSGSWQVSITDLDLELFSTFDRLETLNLRGRKITDLGTRHLARMKNLRSLNLSETAVTSEGLENISTLADLRKLELVELKGVGDTAIPHLLRMKRLEQIDLTGTSVSDKGLEQLAAAPNLRRLFVGASKASREGVELFLKERPQTQVSWWETPNVPAPTAGPGQGPRRPRAAQPAGQAKPDERKKQ